MGKKASHKGKKLYSVYASEIHYGKNKRRKLTNHLKVQPNDLVATKALANVDIKPKRKIPKASRRLNAMTKLFAQIDRKSRAATRAALYQAKRYQEGQTIYNWFDGVNRRIAEEDAEKAKRAKKGLVAA